MEFTSLYTWLLLIIIGIGSWLFFAGLLAVRANKLIFEPKDSYLAQVDVPHRQLWLSNKHQQKIDTIWIDNPAATKIVLYLHGSRGRLSHFFPPLSQKYKVLAPAYPGYHRSEGKPTPRKAYEVALLAYDYLIEQGYAESQIIILGHSLGGATGVYTAAQRPAVGKLVLVNVFNSIFDMCLSKWGIACIFARSIFNSSSYAPYVFTKVRMFHDRNDIVVPYSQGEKLFNNFIATEDKKFIPLPENTTHSDFDMLAVVDTP